MVPSQVHMFFDGLFTTTCTTCYQVICHGMTTRSTSMLFLITANVSFISSLVIHYPAFWLASGNDISRYMLLCSLESGIETSANNTSMVVIHIFKLPQNLPLCHHQHHNLPAYWKLWVPTAFPIWLVIVCFREHSGSFLQISKLLLSLC